MHTYFKAAIVSLALALPLSANAAVLTFEGNICGGPCVDFSPIDQSYGDSAGLDVIYDGNTGKAGDQNFEYWPNSYSTLEDVAFGASGATSSLIFKAASGFEVLLSSFQIGAFPNANGTSRIKLIDLSNNAVLSDTGFITIPGNAPTTFNPNRTSSVGFQLILGPDFFNVGIDNIDVSARQVSAVPLPASALLLFGGLAGLAALRRRRA